MLVGNPKSFAIESCIAEAIESISQRALGYFLIHVAGIAYGVRDQSASMLACSFDEVKSRIARRGTHQVRCLADQQAASVAKGFVDAIYNADEERSYFGLSLLDFERELYASKVQWAPDGDEAFDDGSHILHFDVDNRVRLVAFRNAEGVGNMVSSVWLDGDVFYETLQRWHRAFAVEWSSRVTKDRIR